MNRELHAPALMQVSDNVWFVYNGDRSHMARRPYGRSPHLGAPSLVNHVTEFLEGVVVG